MSTRKRSRKSPTESATLFAIGTVKTGNDGNQWRVETNKNGVKRWVQTKGIKNKTVSKRYLKWREKTALFSVFYQQSKACKDKEEGKCDPFMSDGPLYDIMWNMGGPNNTIDKTYDTAITFDGPTESMKEAKAIVQREYEKIKKRGAISAFVIRDD